MARARAFATLIARPAPSSQPYNMSKAKDRVAFANLKHEFEIEGDERRSRRLVLRARDMKRIGPRKNGLSMGYPSPSPRPPAPLRASRTNAIAAIDRFDAHARGFARTIRSCLYLRDEKCHLKVLIRVARLKNHSNETQLSKRYSSSQQSCGRRKIREEFARVSESALFVVVFFFLRLRLHTGASLRARG